MGEGATLQAIYRYPVKGLTAEPLARTPDGSAGFGPVDRRPSTPGNTSP